MTEAKREPDTTTLVDRCREGNEEAWRALVRRYANLVVSTAYACGLSGDDALEIQQRVWVELYRSLLRIRDPKALPQWLIVTTRRLSVKHAVQGRRFGEEPDTSWADSGPGPEERLQRLQDRHRIEEAMQSLDARCRKVIRMFFEEEDVSYREVAVAMGIKEDSVGSLRTRCLRRLREILGEPA